MKADHDHLASLDGLRAISIALVLCGHLIGTHGFIQSGHGVGDFAYLGVNAFFVISGLLITRLMMLEEARNGGVSLIRFYERRALRLFPAAYVFIGCMGVLTLANFVHLRAADFWHAVTYTMNYYPARSWYVGHLWSLSIEEQFYFLWPLAFVLLATRGRKRAAIAVFVIAPLVRVAVRLFLKNLLRMELFPSVADSLATGCLLALSREWLEKQGWYLRLFRPSWSLSILGLVLVLNRFTGYGIVDAFGRSLINLGLAVLIHRCVMHPGDALGRVLNLRAVAFVGVLSYSLYLWQQPFINRASGAWINAFPQNLAGTIVAAVGSYYLLEKPLLNLRRRLRSFTIEVANKESLSAITVFTGRFSIASAKGDSATQVNSSPDT